jgi:hypothetical protein
MNQMVLNLANMSENERAQRVVMALELAQRELVGSVRDDGEP